MSGLAFIVVFVCQGLLFLVTCQGDVYESVSSTNGRNVVLLGGLFPVHDTVSGNVLCGSLSEDGVQRVESMAYAIEKINRDPKLLPNITLAFSIRDTCASSRHGLDQAFNFVQTARSGEACGSNSSNISISGVVGAQFSRVSIDVAKLLGLYQIPQISYISTAVELGDENLFDYFFRTIPPDNLQAKAIVDIIVKFNWTYVYALYSGNDTYGEGGIRAVVDHLEETGSNCIAERIALPVTDEPKEAFDNAVKKMSSKIFVQNATVAVIFGQLGTAIGMMRAVNESRNNGTTGLENMTWIGTDTWGDSLPDEYRAIAGGIISVLPRAANDSEFDEHFVSLPPKNTSNIWYRELWEDRFGCDISNNSCVEDNMWDKASHEPASQITLVEDAVYAFAHAVHNLVKANCSNGELCAAIMDSQMQAINGTLIRDELYRISFIGPSQNNVSFEREETGSFFVKNMQKIPGSNGYIFKIVGSWDGGLEITEHIQWVTGDTVPKSICSDPCESGSQPIMKAESRCCWTCVSCSGNSVSDGLSSCQKCNESTMPNHNGNECIPIPISHLMFFHSWSIVLLIISSFGLVATMSMILLFLVCFRHKIVKASSREVSAILLIGLILCYTMPFFFVSKPSPAMCAIRRFGVGFSFAICFSALLVKTTRIYRIFNLKALDPSKPPRFTDPLSQVVMTLLLILVQAVMGAIWLAVERPSTKVNYESNKGDLVCGEKPIVYLLISLCYNFVLLLLSTWYAFLARKVPANFNEARYINVTLYTLIIIWLAFIPIYTTTLQFGSIFQTTSFMIAIILSASTTLICIFMPKVYIMIRLRTKEQSNSTYVNTTTNMKKDSSTTR